MKYLESLLCRVQEIVTAILRVSGDIAREGKAQIYLARIQCYIARECSFTR